jgi:hypothetical protein
VVRALSERGRLVAFWPKNEAQSTCIRSCILDEKGRLTDGPRVHYTSPLPTLTWDVAPLGNLPDTKLHLALGPDERGRVHYFIAPPSGVSTPPAPAGFQRTLPRLIRAVVAASAADVGSDCAAASSLGAVSTGAVSRSAVSLGCLSAIAFAMSVLAVTVGSNELRSLAPTLNKYSGLHSHGRPFAVQLRPKSGSKPRETNTGVSFRAVTQSSKQE